MLQVDQKIDKLTVVEIYPKVKGTHRKGLFRCDCGELLKMTLDAVVRPSTFPKSCQDCRPVPGRKREEPIFSDRGFDNWAANAFITGKM